MKKTSKLMLVCGILSLTLAIVPTMSASASLTNAASPENAADSTKEFFSNATASMPVSTPVVEQNPDGSSSLVFAPLWTNHWWIIDYWTYGYLPPPPKLNGTFVAVANTIGGLVSGDSVLYLPLNAAYGPSSSNCVWFQFDVQFTPSSTTWYIWDILGPADDDEDFHYQTIGLTYTVGHTYNFELTTSGQSTVTFTIKDTDTQATWSTSTWQWTVPSLNMLRDANLFSPASAVEGRTTNGQLTNVPYFQTLVGYNIPAHWYRTVGSVPSGISTKLWSGPTYYVYWAMLSQCYMTTATPYAYGSGYVSNSAGIIGSSPDGSYARIYGGGYGDGGSITGSLNAVAGGNVYVYGYTDAGYQSNLYVYASYDNQNWYQIGNTITVTSTTPQWISIGTYLSGFKYIAVAGYNTGNPVSLRIDAVKVGS